MHRRAFLSLSLATLAAPAVAQRALPVFLDPQSAVKAVYDPKLKEAQRPYSKKLKALYAAAIKTSKRLNEPVSGLDFDPLTGSQDADDNYRKTLDFATRPVAAGIAIVEVRLRVFKGQPETRLFFDMVREDESWKIDDISNPDTKDGWRLSTMLIAGAKGQ